jgi:[acyl-carrier-protein] S-malonyltransferase
VEYVLAVLSPGQGAQKPGFLTPWLALDGVPAQLSEWSALAGVDLVHLGTAADADEIKDTARTQPLLTAAALIAAHQLQLPDVCLVAGHSVGELAAAAIAGAMMPEDAIAFSGVRGREMAAACALAPTGMSAVLGGDEAEVLSRLEALDLVPANRNAAGQIVAAGALAALDKLAEDPPEKARVRPLATAGAFHTHFMASAADGYAAAAEGVTTAEPTATLLSNADGEPVASAADAMAKLVNQMTKPVRWDLCTETMRQHNVTAIVEFPPAGTLAGIAKRELRGVPTLAVKSPADLDGLSEL